MSIRIPLTITIDPNDDIDCDEFKVELSIPVPHDLKLNQLNNNRVSGLIVTFNTFEIQCDDSDNFYAVEIKADNRNITYDSTGRTGINFNDMDDYNCPDTFLDKLAENITDRVKVKIDTHWDCYCKTTTVCGCGCDPLHDGW